VAQLINCVQQCATYSRAAHGRTQAAHQHDRLSIRVWPAHDYTTDHDVIVRVHKSAAAYVRELRVSRLGKIVKLYDPDPGSSTFTRQNSGITSGVESHNDS